MTFFISPRAQILDNAQVLEDGAVYRNAVLKDNVVVKGYATVDGGGNLLLSGNVVIKDFAKIYTGWDDDDVCEISGDVIISDTMKITGDAQIFEQNHIWYSRDVLDSFAVTLYRTRTGHRMNIGCQELTLEDDLEGIAAEEHVDLPYDWADLRDSLLKLVSSWH